MTQNAATSLPPGWVESTVRQISSTIQYGLTASAIDKPTGPRFLRITDIQNGRVEWSSVPSCVVAAEDVPKYQLKVGDIVFARTGATTGKSYLIGTCPPAVFASYLIRLRLFPSVAPSYLYAFFQSTTYWQQVEASKRGIGQPNVNASVLSKIAVPLPPLPEQHRIVAEIEKHFTRLDAAMAALERVRAHLRRYRAAVHQAACEGRLVPTEAELAHREGRTYEPADQLLARILKERRARWEAEQLAKMQAKGKVPKDDKWMATYQEPAPPDATDLPEFPEGWLWGALGAIADVRLGKMLSPKAYSEGLLQLPYLRNENVRWGSIDFRDVKKMGFKQSELQRYRLESGDLVVCEGGEAGRCAVYAGAPGQLMYQKALHRVRPFGRLVNPHFIQFCFQHYAASGSVIPRPSETTIQHLPLEKVVVLPVPLPPLPEQRRIVTEVERRLSVVDELDAVVGADLTRAERLRQAILKRAFEGKLVPQDPNDEPASVLLERIRAERAVGETSRATERTRRGRRMQRVAEPVSSVS